MSGAITDELQGTRPDFDELYEDLGGQRLRVFQARGGTTAQDGPAAPDLDTDGNPVTPATPDPTPELPGDGDGGDSWPCFALQMSAKQRAEIGADIAVPTWKVIAHWSAPLGTPGLVLEVSGGELPGPVQLVPMGDIPDVGTQRLAWIFVAQAPDGLRG